MRRYRCFVFCALVLLASTTQIQGQSYQGGLRGAVTDPAGAVVPGAEVTLVNEQTNVGRTTLSNESGEYVFSFVAPGTYKLKVTLSGFKTYERPGISIGTQQFITLDVRLEVGAVSEQITVTAGVPLIETSNANTGGLLSEASLKDLPNTGRNPFMMSLSVPNVIHTGNPFYVRMQDQTNSSQLSLGGGPIRGNNYLIDGVPITDLRNRAIFIPNIDAVSEIKVQVNTYDAEMGRTGGGVFNTTMKSGGNDWHGHAHLQQRPFSWSSNNFFANAAGVPNQEFFYWLWGGSAGGPIKKDKTFFWASHEAYHTGTNWTGVLTVPTDLQRQGDFSKTFDSQGRLVTIYDPLSTKPDPNNPGQFIRTSFDGNRIPSTRMNAVGQGLMKYWPAATRAGDIAGRDNFVASDVLLDDTAQVTGKLDHTFSKKHSISGTYSWYKSREPLPVYFRNTLGQAVDAANYKLFRDVHMPVVNYTMVPNATSVINLRYGYYYWRDSCVAASNGFDLSKLGFDPNFVKQAPAKTFPGFDVEGMNNPFQGYALGGQGDDDVFWRSQSFMANYS